MQLGHTPQWPDLFCLKKAAAGQSVEAGKKHYWPQLLSAHPAVGLGPRAFPDYRPIPSGGVEPHPE